MLTLFSSTQSLTVDPKAKEGSNHASIQTRTFRPETKFFFDSFCSSKKIVGDETTLFCYTLTVFLSSQPRGQDTETQKFDKSSFFLHFIRFVSCRVVLLRFMPSKPVSSLRFASSSSTTCSDCAVLGPSSHDEEDV